MSEKDQEKIMEAMEAMEESDKRFLLGVMTGMAAKNPTPTPAPEAREDGREAKGNDD